jgi:hypothetical protein
MNGAGRKVLRRAAMSAVSLGVTAAVTLAPLPALAGEGATGAAFRLRTPLAAASTGLKLRAVMSLTQEPGSEEVSDAPPPEPGPGPVAVEGPAPAPVPAAPPQPVGPPPPRGLGMLISGSVIVGAVALPSAVFGAYVIAAGRAVNDATDNTGGTGGAAALGNAVGGFFVVFGILALGAGAPLIGVGAVRLKRYNDWKAGQQVRLTPHGGRTAYGTWTAGLQLRF